MPKRSFSVDDRVAEKSGTRDAPPVIQFGADLISSLVDRRSRRPPFSPPKLEDDERSLGRSSSPPIF